MEEKEENKEKEKQPSTMSRRDFLKSAGLAVGGVAASGGLAYMMAGCQQAPVAPTGTEVPAAPGAAPAAPAAPPSGGGEIKTVYKGASFVGSGGGSPNAVDTMNGKIIRIRPFHYDEKFTPDQYKSWKIEARGKTFIPPSKTLPNKLSLCYKTRVYSPNRILYPMKRVDWSPENRNPQTRGISKYKRITWDEATDLIASELKRQYDTYGPCSVMHMGDGHGESHTVHSIHGCPMRLLELMGGYTKMVRNPDSWEGFWWGSKHVWGDGWMGLMAPQTNVMKDVFENTQMILFWGSDPETTYATFSDMLSSRECNFYTELGIKQVFVCPDLNYAASVHADKWIPVLPNTDPTFQLAIAYTWITEGTYDKEYVDTHTVGFDKFRAYVMGDEDGTPKTPEWAAPICGVSEWTIKALAREWAKVATCTHHNCGGSFIRGPYSTEPARLESLLVSMQGIGKPGVHQISEQRGWADYERRPSVAAAYRAGEFSAAKLPGQVIPKTLITKGILNPPISWYSLVSAAQPVEDQFVKYTYPSEGKAEVSMIWSDSPCWSVNWNNGNTWQKLIRDQRIECFVVQHPWFEDDAFYADIVLPTNTMYEHNDIGTGGIEYKVLYLENKATEPVGESVSDYEAVIEVAKKLGLEEKLTEGKSVDDWIKFGWEKSGVNDLVTWEQLQEKECYVVPTKEGWENASPGWRTFYEDPVKNPLKTPSGKLEFYSDRLAQNFPDDKERPPSPQWVPEGVTHQETLGTERGKKYPLLCISNHGHWREHAMHDDVPWFREIELMKVKGPDGYLYEAAWIHPETAKSRGIQKGDIVRIFNERGSVLGGAYVTERIKPGVVYMDHGAKADPIHDTLDRGGNINAIVPTEIISKNCAGMATSGFLVDLERVGLDQLDKWMKDYPEAFKREYDPVFGLTRNAWIEGKEVM